VAAKTPSVAPARLFALPGRLRFRNVAEVRRDPRAEARANRVLGKIPGVTSVETSRWTGSVLVRFDPDVVKTADLIAALQRARFASVRAMRDPDPSETGGVAERIAGFALNAALTAVLGEVFIPLHLALKLLEHLPKNEITDRSIQLTIPALKDRPLAAAKLEKALSLRPGVESAAVDAAWGQVRLKFEKGAITTGQLETALRELGLVREDGTIDARNRSQLSRALSRAALDLAKHAVFEASRGVLKESLGETAVKAIAFLI
jgi:copper chaperone CopZ